MVSEENASAGLPPLPQPATYFPLSSGRYSVAPALHRLGTDFTNGVADVRLFQFDSEFSRFRQNKLQCRSERFGKYVCAVNLPADVQEAAARFVTERLTTEYPVLFLWIKKSSAGCTLQCRLTEECLHFDARMRLTNVTGGAALSPAYADALDALCSQLPEDMALVLRDPASGGDWLAYLHLCAPSHWAGEEKIGGSWSETHGPVPGMEKSRSAAAAIVRVMIEREATVRFTWGIEFDNRLNHHPLPPPNIPAAVWNNRGRRPADTEPFYLRVERQVIWGLPAVNAAVFAIRVYHTPASALLAIPARRESLRRALLSMPEESRRYKALDRCWEEVLLSLG